MYVRIQRGTGGPDPPPPRKSQNIGFFSNTVPDPLKIVKLPSQLSILGHNRHVAFRWRALKNVAKVRPPLTKLSESAHVVVTDK